MTFGQELVKARKQGDKLAFGLIALLVVEFFGLSVLTITFVDKYSSALGSAITFGTMVATFFVAYFYQFRIIDPLIEKGGDLFEKNAMDRDLQKGLMDEIRRR